MKIALDYDNTYSAAPEFWNAFIDMALTAGHQVRIVTARDERFDRTPSIAEAEKIVPVVYCRGVAKRWFMTHFGKDFVPDIWIDDKPESIIENSNIVPADLARWRHERNEGPCQ